MTNTARPTRHWGGLGGKTILGGHVVSSPTPKPFSVISTPTSSSGDGSPFCIYDYVAVGIALVYFVLTVRCVVLTREHMNSWSNRQANGLIWYLVCSGIMCACRFSEFFILPFLGLACDSAYRVWSWETDGIAFFDHVTLWKTDMSMSSAGKSSFTPHTNSTKRHKALALALGILSTASIGLFFTSYTFFAHSLAKVLEMLTLESVNSSSESRFLVLLLSLVMCVWLSVAVLWTCLAATPRYEPYVDTFAQSSVAFAALSTCLAFSALFVKALFFLCRHDRDVGKAAQLHRLLGLRRVKGVCRVCTVVFFLRALELLLRERLSLPGWAEYLYFLLLEVAPTVYMLQAFRSSSLSDAVSSRGGPPPANEFDVLKATLTSNLAVVSSPARTGFTSRYYATPDKSSVQSYQDAEERSRLLHTPGSDISTLDALELEGRGGADGLYRL